MITIRVATEADAEEILAIYAKYIEQTAITFEYVVPSIEEFRGRIRHTSVSSTHQTLPTTTRV